MVFLVDASVVAGWFLPDERTGTSDAPALRMVSEDAIAPDLFWHEARSLLLAALRRGRIPEAAVYMSLDRLATIPLRNAGASDATTAARLAIKPGLSAYDSAYPELALRERAPLATVDKKLAAAAKCARPSRSPRSADGRCWTRNDSAAPWQPTANAISAAQEVLETLEAATALRRSEKSITMMNYGTVISMKDRQKADLPQ